jgi:hypothetical protein
MRKLIMTLAILGSIAVVAPIASAQTRCYSNNWGRVTCVHYRNDRRRDSDDWRWRRHYREHHRDRDDRR